MKAHSLLVTRRKRVSCCLPSTLPYVFCYLDVHIPIRTIPIACVSDHRCYQSFFRSHLYAYELFLKQKVIILSDSMSSYFLFAHSFLAHTPQCWLSTMLTAVVYNFYYAICVSGRCSCGRSECCGYMTTFAAAAVTFGKGMTFTCTCLLCLITSTMLSSFEK